ncbi:MAG: ATP-binding protein [Candidatus Woesearchaeota archaeon]
MILGKIGGKISTESFKFTIEKPLKKFDYLQIMHPDNHYVLSQVLDIEKEHGKTVAICGIIGFRDKRGILRSLRSPFDPGIEVLVADDDFVKETLGLENNKGVYFGTLEGREKLKVFLDINKLLTRHVFIAGKTGTGKSYTVATILEELLEHNVPLVIIDPHGEYSTLKQPNAKDRKKLEHYSLKPKGYSNITEFSPDTESNPEARALKLSNQGMTPSELIHLLPAKLSASQQGTLYSALKNMGNKIDFNELIFELEASEEGSAKWTLINILEYIKKQKLFSSTPTLPSELVQARKCSIINLKGVAPEVQEVVVYKLASDLFMERRKGNIPPFFLVVEEAQNFCPERSFGEAKSSSILRQIASEGRKFGLGMAIITQRPARVDKNVISQAATQIILKVTNPNDIRAISNSVEGITPETEKEIKNISIGMAMVTGIVDLPLFVAVKPRRSKHGGEAVKIFDEEPAAQEKDFLEQSKEFEEKGELTQVIMPKISKKDIELMSDKPVKVKTTLVPCLLLALRQDKQDFNILIDLSQGIIITDTEQGSGFSLSEMKLGKISPQQERVLKIALKQREFSPADLFAKSGVQFSDLYDIINVLVRKGYFVKGEGNSFYLSKDLSSLAELKQYACYEKADYKRVEADKTLKPSIKIDEVKQLLCAFAEIRNVRECFFVKYST